jgi:hypothetical protein
MPGYANEDGFVQSVQNSPLGKAGIFRHDRILLNSLVIVGVSLVPQTYEQ